MPRLIGTKYILHPPNTHNIVRKEVDGLIVKLVDVMLGGTNEYQNLVRFCGDKPESLDEEIWVPNVWLFPYVEDIKGPKCICDYYVVINRGCKCGGR